MGQRCGRRFRAKSAAILGLCIALTFSGSARLAAQEPAIKYPIRTIRIVVPFPAGGPTDAVARVLAQELLMRLGKPVLIENHPGATGAIGSDAVAKAEPDGYTLLVAGTATHALQKVGNPKLPYDPLKDFKPVIEYGSYPVGVMVAKKLPAQNLRELIAVSRTTEGGLLLGVPGTGSVSHVFGLQLVKETGAKITFVPFRGDAPARLALLVGNIHGIASAPDFGMIGEGSARLIGSSGEERWPQAADVPTFAEQGFPSLNGGLLRWGFAVPAKTPDSIVRILNEATNEALKADRVKRVMIDNAYFVGGGPPQLFWTHLAQQIVTLEAVFQRSGIKLDY
jgi:tripartite-type tricarboxylate transporter receptor subunit TctC